LKVLIAVPVMNGLLIAVNGQNLVFHSISAIPVGPMVGRYQCRQGTRIRERKQQAKESLQGGEE
jgi:hypothetical protein